MSQPAKTIAFFGATGGCALTALEHSLRAGYHCAALVRSGDKLKGMLSRTTPTTSLRIVEGDATNPQSVRDVLVDPTTNAVVDSLVYGLGYRPTTNNPLTWKFTTPTLCEDTTRLIMQTLEDLRPAVPPFATFISTTGTDHSGDVPTLMTPFYHYSLKVPHADKAKMEEVVYAARDKGAIRDWLIVRPSLLTDGEATHGQTKIGFEGSDKKELKSELNLSEGGCGWRSVNGLAVGYTICRKDVGAFVFEEGVFNGGEKFKGKKVRLTH
ncbi:hypothetical protein H072_11436 [Dactylellina haptotyla CBS 200.50]|uniref:NAD(P)-binding domain-containing protein n=1 Tax=Dactylellina haptotyla (strain CBS 200.50) TaxID=1284197 RepID=S8A1Y8_DACHA|nr:hypothetical protein H072_11436 [Dactylellina haptotyla CBS 200.50]